MVCGGFTCSRNALIALNTLYILVSLLLIILPAVAKAQAYVHSLFAVGGIIACGVFLLLVSVLGLIGAIRHHQVCLFFVVEESKEGDSGISGGLWEGEKAKGKVLFVGDSITGFTDREFCKRDRRNRKAVVKNRPIWILREVLAARKKSKCWRRYRVSKNSDDFAVYKNQELLVKRLVIDTKASFEKQLAKEVKYMILLFLIFLLELFISILCLAVSTDRIRVLVADTWKNEDKLREEFQIRYCCCKLHSNDTVKDVDCDEYVPQDCLPESPPEDSKYNYCEEDWVSVAKHGLNYCGGLGLFFSFTEILGVVITFRFRHLKDPRANPNAFL
ncbi:Tetraspanin-31 [Holothuria leucospilota]|uniref:Tetraspanin-31 n=1 Tax=Holothuria leucospilota TaxID=206669 RepID=A0A9Q1C1R3_HOLLE|nr:Tetraspanin-31 [Holothuria leucospilota]